ncbi:hypothetical protein [Paenibacillus contaminans]|uniref:Uncharacterized protein n=1 Tax=Paenibacillus contaminans TaxID=450362 RepID=A0A329MRW4_9BACL|nr:hypothetical protein [Paenibacillus contaminans]RAV22675.1 hypothetical protein DQG23_00190 [Paenibacillus contaminans]
MNSRIRNNVNKQIDKFGNDTILISQNKTKCDGAWNMDAFDKLQDSIYHKNNPAAPVCSMGHIIAEATATEKAIMDFVTVVSDKILYTFGNVEVGDIIATFKEQLNIREYEIVQFQGKSYKIEAVKEDIYGNVRLRWIVHLKRGDAHGK